MDDAPRWDADLLLWLRALAKDRTLADGPRPPPFADLDADLLWAAGAMVWVLGHRGATWTFLAEALTVLLPQDDAIASGLHLLADKWEALAARHLPP